MGGRQQTCDQMCYDDYIDGMAARFDDRATLGPTTEPKQVEVLTAEVYSGGVLVTLPVINSEVAL